MRVRSMIVTSLLVSMAACTGETATRAPEGSDTSPLEDVLVFGTPSGSVIVGSSTGVVLSSGRDQVASPDGSRLYGTMRRGGSTVIETRDSSTSDVLATTTVEGLLDVRVASLSGETVALMRPLPAGVDPAIAIPRARTRIVVVDPAGGRTARSYDLKGNFEPEAFSVDDTRLFLIQFLPAEAPSAYRVTFLDLEDGEVHPVFGRFKAPPERMPGIRLAQVFDATSEQLYTLYTNRVAGHFHDHWQDASSGDREVSFVHVLNLREGWAYCAGLPRTLWGQPASAQAMAPSPDGRRLYIVDSLRGLVAEMDTRSMEIIRTARVKLSGAEGGRTSAMLSEDGHTLFVGDGSESITRIDVDSFAPIGPWPLSGKVTGLALSEDGARLYAALGERVAVVDTSTGADLGTLSFGPTQSILHVATP
jgi:hypothetical protein